MKKSVLFAGLALFAVAACNKPPNVDPKPVDFSQYAVRVEPVITRATETNFEKGDQIGLCIVRAAGDYAANAQLTYDGTAFSGDLNWYDEGAEESTLKAYYPYKEGEALPTRFTVQADQSEGTAASDFVSAVKENVLPSANAVSMVFKHRLSRLVVTVKNNSGAAIEAVRFQEIIPVANIGADLTAKVDENAKWQTITAFADGDKYYAIVPGQKVAPVVVVTAGGKELSRQGIAELDPRVEKDLIAYALEEYFGHLPADVIGHRQDSLRKAFSGDYRALAAHLWDNPYELMDFVTEVKIAAFNEREQHTGDLTELTRSYTRALYHDREARDVVQYPDANSTMRLTYGVVSALEPWDAVYTSWYSTPRGLREKYDPAQHDFALPADFVTALDGYAGPVNFLTDNDISGGNSGSPVLNARGELIGLAFDGNKESLASDVSYTPDYNKCVCVDIRYVLWILRDYVGLDRIVKEID